MICDKRSGKSSEITAIPTKLVGDGGSEPERSIQNFDITTFKPILELRYTKEI
jgi:hypothetical protein